MIRRIQDQGGMVVLVGLKLGLLGDEYRPLYEEIANEFGALLVPNVREGIFSDPRLKSDSIHPDGAGYAIMAERIIEQVKP
jgi:acyl-CoA thioesterase-1